jgi:DNA polymerase III alpha subunit
MRWCSPTTTACTEPSGSTTPPASSGSGSGSAPSCRSTCPHPRAASPTPAGSHDGSHLLVIARQQEGYHRLCRVISHAQLAGGEKGRPLYDLDDLVDEPAGHVVVLIGCRKGAVRHALAERGRAAALPR